MIIILAYTIAYLSYFIPICVPVAYKFEKCCIVLFCIKSYADLCFNDLIKCPVPVTDQDHLVDQAYTEFIDVKAQQKGLPQAKCSGATVIQFTDEHLPGFSAFGACSVNYQVEGLVLFTKGKATRSLIQIVVMALNMTKRNWIS